MKAPKAVMAVRMVSKSAGSTCQSSTMRFSPKTSFSSPSCTRLCEVEVLLRGDAHHAGQRLVGGQPREILAQASPVAVGRAAEDPLRQLLGEGGGADRAPAQLPHEGERRQPLIGLEPQPEVQHLVARS